MSETTNSKSLISRRGFLKLSAAAPAFGFAEQFSGAANIHSNDFGEAANARSLHPGSHIPSDDLRDGFANPPMAVRPMVRYFWPGGNVTDAEISRELRIMKEAGIGGVEIQSFVFGLNPHPGPEVAARVNSFLSPEWFAHVKHTIIEGQRLGMIVDLTLGSAWPYGGTHIPKELGAKFLDMEVTPLKGPSVFEGKIPWVRHEPPINDGYAFPVAADPKLYKLVAVVAVRGTMPEISKRFGWNEIVARSGEIDPASAVVLTTQVSGDRRLRWSVPDGNWLLCSFIQVPTAQQVACAAGVDGTRDLGRQYVLDHMSKAALQLHIDAIGEAGKKYYGDKYGNGLRAIFCDSLEVIGYNAYWTDGFLDDFRRMRGYDLTPYLPLFKHPGHSDPRSSYSSLPVFDAPEIGDRIRHDYWRTVSDVMIANFYQPLIDWANRNHLLARIQAHGSPTDNLKVYGHSNIAETESLYDHGNYDFLKYASSGSHVYGHNITSSESLVWYMRDYETTPQKIKHYTDEMLTAGVNETIYAGFPYEYMDRPEPGWYPFSTRYHPDDTYSTHLNFHNPFWAYLPPLNDYIARIQYLSQNSRFVAPVAIYSHFFIFPQKPTDQNYPLEYSLMAHGYNFDFINEDILVNHASVVDHQLKTPGSTYKALVFRNEQRLSLALVRKLHEFSQQGLPIVFVETVPSAEIGFHNHIQNSGEISQLITEMLGDISSGGIASRATKKKGSTIFVKDDTRVPVLLARSLGIQPDLRFEPAQPDIYFAEFQHGATRFYFLRNPKPQPQQAHVLLTGEGAPEIWDPWTGSISNAQQYDSMEGRVVMDLHFAPYGSMVVVMGGAKEAVHIKTSNFPEVRWSGGQLIGITHRPGEFQAFLGNGNKIRVEIADEEIPSTLTLGPDWFVKAVGRDKNGKQYTLNLHIPELKDWSLISQLQYFTGQGHYRLNFSLADGYLKPGLTLDLDLGDVHDVAEVWINGRRATTLLLPPYHLDATAYLRAGNNHLEVVVQNTLRNRMVLDGRLGDPNFVIFKNRDFWLPSGLLGPVRLSAARAVSLQ